MDPHLLVVVVVVVVVTAVAPVATSDVPVVVASVVAVAAAAAITCPTHVYYIIIYFCTSWGCDATIDVLLLGPIVIVDGPAAPLALPSPVLWRCIMLITMLLSCCIKLPYIIQLGPWRGVGALTTLTGSVTYYRVNGRQKRK